MDDQNTQQEPDELTFNQTLRQEALKIKNEIENRKPRLSDRVLFDAEWIPECGREPNPDIEGRIVGINLDSFIVMRSFGTGQRLTVHFQAVKLL